MQGSPEVGAKKKAKKRQEKFAKFVGEKKYIKNTRILFFGEKKNLPNKKGQEKKRSPTSGEPYLSPIHK